MSDIIIADRLTDANQRLVPNVAELQASWAINEPGLLSFTIPYRDLAGAGAPPTTLLGRWLHYQHPTAGPWGGKITNVSGTDGIVTVNAQSWLAELRGWLWDDFVAGSGNLATRLTRMLTALQGKTGITTSTTYDLLYLRDPEGGVSGDLLDSVLPGALQASLAAAGSPTLLSLGYTVDPLTRVFSFNILGSDKSASVEINDGDEALTSSVTRDRDSAYGNFVRLKARYLSGGSAVSATINAIDQTAVTRFGTIYVDVDQTGGAVYGSLAAANAAAQAILAQHRRQQSLVSLAAADERGAWALVREGDAITASLGLAGLRGPMLVRHRALDEARAALTIAGEAELVDPTAPPPVDPPTDPPDPPGSVHATFVQHIMVGQNIRGLNANAFYVYLTRSTGGDVWRYDPQSGGAVLYASGFPGAGNQQDIVAAGGITADAWVATGAAPSTGAIIRHNFEAGVNVVSPVTGRPYWGLDWDAPNHLYATVSDGPDRGIYQLHRDTLVVLASVAVAAELRGLAVGGGRLYVANATTHRIEEYRLDLTPTGISWGGYGGLAGQLISPSGVEHDATHNRVLVADTGNNRVQIFSPTGSFLGSFGEDQMAGPVGVSSFGDSVYVTDVGNNRISEWIVP